MSTHWQNKSGINDNGRAIQRQLYVLGVLILLCVLFEWFKHSPQRVEQYYTQCIYHGIAAIQQTLFGWIPFSAGDLFYASVVIWMIWWLFRSVRHFFQRRWQRGITYVFKTVNLMLSLYLIFYLFWAFNYYRQPLSQHLGLDGSKPVFADLLVATVDCIDSVNALRAAFTDKDWDWSDQAVFEESAGLLAQHKILHPTLFWYNPKAKAPLANSLSNYMGISGYFNPYTHEAQVNVDMPLFNRPFTACHELAHQAGIGFEDEANFVGFMLARESEHLLFRYSAYYTALWMLMQEVYLYDRQLYSDLYGKIHADVMDDALQQNAFWEPYLGRINTLTNVFYGNYLEANNQPEGMQRYNQMVRLLVAWSIKGKPC